MAKKKPEFIGTKKTKALVKKVLGKKKFNVSMTIYQDVPFDAKPISAKDLKIELRRIICGFRLPYHLSYEFEAKSIRIDVDNGK
jgi:hypothetical protein